MTVTVAVVFGGPSAEHEVSLAGARCVVRHAAEVGWTAHLVGIAKDERWLVGPDALAMLWREANRDRLPSGTAAQEPPPFSGVLSIFDGPLSATALSGVKIAFPVGHGRFMEDGTLQDLLASHGLAVIGCSADASALCFDKPRTRAVLAAAGIPVARGLSVSIDDYARAATGAAERVRSVLGPGKLFVKPARGGSSLGITAVPSDAKVGPALEAAFVFDTAALVEEFVPHRELVVGVVGNDDLFVSPPGECRPVGDLYTYEEKYRLGNPGFRCPADLDPATTEAARSLAVRAYRASGCSGFARVDLFLDLRTGGLLVNEINTIPGMTAVSVFPTIMDAAGWSYPRLLQEILATGAR